MSLSLKVARRQGYIFFLKPLEKEGEDLFYDDDPEYEILQQEWTFGTGRYLMSVEYFDLIDKMENKLNMYFLGAGLGVIKHISTLKLTVREDSTGDIGSLDDTYKENKFILNFKGGIVREITKEVGINFSASFDIVVLGRENPYDMNSKMMYSSIPTIRFKIFTVSILILIFNDYLLL